MLIAALMAAGVLLAAGDADADTQQDYTFYSILESNGVTVTSPKNAKLAAAAICAELAAGTDWRLIVTTLMTEGDFDLNTASTIVSASITAYCPQFSAEDQIT